MIKLLKAGECLTLRQPGTKRRISAQIVATGEFEIALEIDDEKVGYLQGSCSLVPLSGKHKHKVLLIEERK